jgi:hypothetical protein
MNVGYKKSSVQDTENIRLQNQIEPTAKEDWEGQCQTLASTVPVWSKPQKAEGWCQTLSSTGQWCTCPPFPEQHWWQRRRARHTALTTPDSRRAPLLTAINGVQGSFAEYINWPHNRVYMQSSSVYTYGWSKFIYILTQVKIYWLELKIYSPKLNIYAPRTGVILYLSPSLYMFDFFLQNEQHWPPSPDPESNEELLLICLDRSQTK